jgi:hypothetical protein
MVFWYYGSSMHPGEVNTCMGQSACPWKFADGANNCSQNKAAWYAMLSPTHSNIRWALSNGYPPSIEVKSRGHWVVIYGVSGSGTDDSYFYTVDPAGGVTRTLDYYTPRTWTK